MCMGMRADMCIDMFMGMRADMCIDRPLRACAIAKISFNTYAFSNFFRHVQRNVARAVLRHIGQILSAGAKGKSRRVPSHVYRHEH